MSIIRRLFTSRQNEIIINSNDQLVEQHFNNLSNYADHVLTDMNRDRYYDWFFTGAKDLTVLDIGANIGLFSLYVQDSAKIVYSIEPTPNHFHVLTELTKSYDNIKRINAALHSSDEQIDFYISEENSTMNSTVNKYGQKVMVQGYTLESLLNGLSLDHVDFVKCDIEGSEMIAITDQTVGAVRDRIRIWYMECHATDHSRWAASLQENRDTIAEVFVRQGYKVYKLKHDTIYAQRD